MNDEVHMKEVDQVILQFVISRDWMRMYSFIDIDSEFMKKMIHFSIGTWTCSMRWDSKSYSITTPVMVFSVTYVNSVEKCMLSYTNDQQLHH